MEADQIFTTPGASEFLNVPVATLRWWRHKGTGPKGFKIGARKVMYKKSDLIAWLDKQYNAEQVS